MAIVTEMVEPSRDSMIQVKSARGPVGPLARQRASGDRHRPRPRRQSAGKWLLLSSCGTHMLKVAKGSLPFHRHRRIILIIIIVMASTS